MSKRPASDVPSSSSKLVRNGPIRESAIQTDEMGEFEDAWEDEIEDEVMDGGEGDDGMDLFNVVELLFCMHYIISGFMHRNGRRR